MVDTQPGYKCIVRDCNSCTLYILYTAYNTADTISCTFPKAYPGDLNQISEYLNQLWNAITGSGLANLCDCYVVAVEEGVGGGGGGIFTNKVLEDMDKGLV